MKQHLALIVLLFTFTISIVLPQLGEGLNRRNEKTKADLRIQGINIEDEDPFKGLTNVAVFGAARIYEVDRDRFPGGYIVARTNRGAPADITIFYRRATNWTGVTHGTNELGYVVTNKVSQVVYQGVTNETQFHTDLTGIAVWRQRLPEFKFIIGTNRIQGDFRIYPTNTYWTNNYFYIR